MLEEVTSLNSRKGTIFCSEWDEFPAFQVASGRRHAAKQKLGLGIKTPLWDSGELSRHLTTRGRLPRPSSCLRQYSTLCHLFWRSPNLCIHTHKERRTERNSPTRLLSSDLSQIVSWRIKQILLYFLGYAALQRFIPWILKENLTLLRQCYHVYGWLQYCLSRMLYQYCFLQHRVSCSFIEIQSWPMWKKRCHSINIQSGSVEKAIQHLTARWNL